MSQYYGTPLGLLCFVPAPIRYLTVQLLYLCVLCTQPSLNNASSSRGPHCSQLHIHPSLSRVCVWAARNKQVTSCNRCGIGFFSPNNYQIYSFFSNIFPTKTDLTLNCWVRWTLSRSPEVDFGGKSSIYHIVQMHNLDYIIKNPSALWEGTCIAAKWLYDIIYQPKERITLITVLSN